jgi:arylsulfatase A-like enzyme
LTLEALRFIDENRGAPFFLYLAYPLPHANNEAGNNDAGGNGMEVPDLGVYQDRDWPNPQKGLAAMVTRLDGYVGQILDHLRQLGIDENTIIFFASDNGPHREGGNDPDFFKSSGPLRGIKRDLHEGGIRTPMIVRWPQHVPGGVVSDQIGYFPDFLPTVVELTGAQGNYESDGVSLVPSILGRERHQVAHDYLYWEFYERGTSQAVRMGRWKAVRQPIGGKTELYDLDEDVGEQHDLAGQQPEIVREIESIMAKAHTPSALWPAPEIPP